MKVVILFSGGQDSTTALYWAKREWPNAELLPLVFLYNQRHMEVEIRAAGEIAGRLGLAPRYVSLGSIWPPRYGESALLDRTRPITPGDATSLPNTFVPGRNLVFLAVAAAYAAEKGATKIVIGANAVDYSGYPDCRPRFLSSVEQTIRLALGSTAEDALVVEAPLLELSKAQIVRLARVLGDDCWRAVGASWSCYDPVRVTPWRPCGACPACVLRAKGFAEAGEKDPAL